jgi:hypothetical protein
VALACRAVGIDRCVFTTVYTLSRRARGEHAALGADAKIAAERIFDRYTRPGALARLHDLAAATG